MAVPSLIKRMILFAGCIEWTAAAGEELFGLGLTGHTLGLAAEK